MYYVTKKGLEFLRSKIKKQEEIVKDASREIEEEGKDICNNCINSKYEDAKKLFEIESNRLQKFIDDFDKKELISVEDDEKPSEVKIGTTAVLDVSGDSREYTIGAFEESYPEKGLVSYLSPLGSYLLNMKVNDSKEVNIGGKSVKIKVIKIFPASFQYNSLIKEFFDRHGLV
ncbi:GreA/GreB family elongation factor [Patescibacteria group bacterium]|nr:GreA/GreB family elongation factor [Patescibacteria group bacterium]